jgi:acyl-CoA synthetase (AMP-forming)/AMP-acid ligase II
VVRVPGATATEPELVAWCRQNMAAYKYPRIVEFRDSLPMTATGKILKRELAQQAQPGQAQPGQAQSGQAQSGQAEPAGARP